MFLPENIDLAYSERYNLSIRLSPNGFSFCIYCPGDPTIFHFQETALGGKLSYIDNIKKLIFDLGFFSQAFNQVTVTIVSPFYTLVPEDYFEKKRIEEIFRFNFHDTNGIILTDSTPDSELRTLFNVDEEVHSFLSRNLWNPTFHHHSSRLTHLFKSHRGNENGKCCFADFHDKYVTTVSFSGNKLISTNTFQATDPHDATYFIASVWEKLAFDQSTDRLFISGDIDSQRATVDLLRKLIRRVEQVALNPKVMLTEGQKRTLPTDILADLCV
ncbi:DUF3822 family protein [uncultured Proteiniphilum sp.]|uniref:DUF3822 family protein n=1 Tax=uncultured Proteiniphilum sp. TaxID=497637 RepID=UPI002606E664|nr:DUF3822 family protein [uncultured Proteiniphilum sp.]